MCTREASTSGTPPHRWRLRGGRSVHLAGGRIALEYNRSDPSLPDLIVCRPELAPAIVDFVQRHGT